jgi:hypothetical protein
MNKNLWTGIALLGAMLFLPNAANLCFGQKHPAPAPMYRDPVTDGAADPVVFWNRQEKCWWMLYTQRRANQEGADVAYCFGNPIGIAESDDNGQSWYYRGQLNLEFEHGHNTFWAPEVVYDKGVYHLFVAYIKGVHNHFGVQAHLIHYTSENLWNWKYCGPLDLGSDRVIDITVFRKPDGTWRAWYKDENAGSLTSYSDSKDLFYWTKGKIAINGASCEGPKVFRFKNYYWMLTDEWQGLRLYRSTDLNTWEHQGRILTDASSRPDDTPSGAHCDVVVTGEKAYVIYFTHPGRHTHVDSPADSNGNIPYALRRSSIQCAELLFRDGTLVTDRTNDFDFFLPNGE